MPKLVLSVVWNLGFGWELEGNGFDRWYWLEIGWSELDGGWGLDYCQDESRFVVLLIGGLDLRVRGGKSGYSLDVANGVCGECIIGVQQGADVPFPIAMTVCLYVRMV